MGTLEEYLSKFITQGNKMQENNNNWNQVRIYPCNMRESTDDKKI